MSRRRALPRDRDRQCRTETSRDNGGKLRVTRGRNQRWNRVARARIHRGAVRPDGCNDDAAGTPNAS